MLGALSLPFDALTAISAAVLAIVSGGAFGDFVYQSLLRKSILASMSEMGTREKALLILSKCSKPFVPLGRFLMSKSRVIRESVENFKIIIAEHGLDVPTDILMADLLALSTLSLLVGLLIGRSPTFGVAAACITFIGALSFARNRFTNKNVAMREEIPEALRTMTMLFRSGHSLPQVLSDLSYETKGYLGYLFKVAAERLDMGASPQEALAIMKGDERVPELSFVAVALDIQHQSGGSIARVLESAMESVEGELKLARSLRVQTAQAKLSASIVTIMPFLLIALFSMFSPDFLSPFFASPLGMAVLAIALVMQLSGVLAVRQILNAGGE